MMNRALLRSIQRTNALVHPSGGRLYGGYGGTATDAMGRERPAFDVQALRDQLQEQVERERDALAADLLKIRAEVNPDQPLVDLAERAAAAAAIIYPDVPPVTEEDASDAP